MWVNSATGEVLIETYRSMLLATVDDGTHWNAIDYPAGVYISDPHAPEFTARAPSTASGYLMICGVFTDNQIGAHPWIACTTDDGATWSHNTANPVSGFGIGGNGDIFGSGPNEGNQMWAIFRLTPGGAATSDWQRLGVIPGSNYGSTFQVAPAASGASVFWVFPVVNTLNYGSYTQTITQPYYYVATYP